MQRHEADPLNFPCEQLINVFSTVHFDRLRSMADMSFGGVVVSPSFSFPSDTWEIRICVGKRREAEAASSIPMPRMNRCFWVRAVVNSSRR